MGAETREQDAKIIDFAQGDPLFARLRVEAEEVLRREPELGGFLHPAILSQSSAAGVVAQSIHGTNYAIPGSDGVHPDWAGQTVMAWAFHSSNQKVCQTLGKVPALTMPSRTPSSAGSGNQAL